MPIPSTEDIKELFRASFGDDIVKLERAINLNRQKIKQQKLKLVDGVPQNFVLITMFTSSAAASVEISPDKNDVEKKLWDLAYLTVLSFRGSQFRNQFTNRNMVVHLLENTVFEP